MAAGSRYDDEDSGGMITDINVTPLVDITLVLLIIFMVTAHLIVNKAIPGVDTPKAASGEEVRTTLALTIDNSRALFVNGQKVGERRIAHTNPSMFSADEAADVGVDEGTPVTEAYTAAGSRFTGRIRKVTVELK